jgi:hypothetical protein
MSNALGQHTGSDIFREIFSKFTKMSTKTLLRPAWRQIVVHQTIQADAHVHRVYCVVQLGQTPFCQTKQCRYLLPVTVTISQFYLMRLYNSCSFCACLFPYHLFSYNVYEKEELAICNPLRIVSKKKTKFVY